MVTANILDLYDIYYINPAADKMGFMLARGKGGSKAWQRTDSSPLPESFAPGDISYANLSPDVQKVISQRYLHGGLGALEFEVEDDVDYQILRYLKSQNIDCRCKGKAYPGPKIVAISTFNQKSVTPTWVTATGGSGTNWSTPADAYDGDTDTSASWYTGSGSVWSDYYTFILPANWCGRTRLYISSTGTCTTMQIDVYDGSWTNIYNATPSYGGWVTIDHTDQFISMVRVHFYHTAAGTVYLHEGQTETAAPGAASGVTTCHAVFNDINYINKGAFLCKQDAGGTSFTVFQRFRTNITRLTSWGGYLFISISGSYSYCYMTTAGVFTQSNLSNSKAEMLCKVGASLASLVLPNSIRFSTNPLNGGAWGNAVNCGGSDYNVNDMWEHDGILYCLKEDGSYYYNSGTTSFYPAFPELATIAHDDSGKNSTVFRGGLYFRMGNQQEWEIKDGVLTEVTPSLYSQGIADYTYPCVARAHDESWLYDIIKRGDGDLAILAGRWEYMAGRTRWIWHEIRSVDLTDVGLAFVCSVEGRPYLYLASTEADEDVYKVYLPVTNDATADEDYRFHIATPATATLGSLWTPRYMTLLYAINKRWQELFMRSENLTETNYITASYSTDDGASFTPLADFDTSPEQTEEFTDIESTMLNLQLDFVGDDEELPPVLKYHNLKAMTMMESLAKFVHTVKCDKKPPTLKANFSAPTDYTYANIRAFIDTIRDTVCTLGDVSGIEHKVRVRVLNEVEVFDEDDKRPMLHYTIEATKL